MSRAWNIGNTTVRNPKRIEMGFKLIRQNGLEASLEGKENEKKLAEMLVQAGVVDSKGSQSDWLGRKWRSVMVKLGLLTDKSYKIEGKSVRIEKMGDKLGIPAVPYSITPMGMRLINAQSAAEVSDIFLHQLFVHELPNSIEKKIELGSSRIKPFIFLLQVLLHLKGDDAGLNQQEIAVFLQKIANHDKEYVESVVADVLNYRSERNKLSSKREKLIYDKQLLESVATEMHVKRHTPRDYADTTVRYFSMTGLFEMRGSRFKIKDDSVAFVERLVQNEPRFIGSEDPIQYLKDFYCGSDLPTDSESMLKGDLAALIQKSEELKISTPDIKTKSLTVAEMKAEKYKLEEDILKSRENSFAFLQQSSEQVKDIVEGLTLVSNKNRAYIQSVTDMPAHLEWMVWRGFLAIDHIANPISDTRGFPVDVDLQPRYPAPGGRPDMSFEFDDYSLVVEVTLTTSTRQYVAECEPVRRHVANAVGPKQALGLFIAPTLDNNFLHGVRDYYKADILVKLNILPITLSDFVRLLEVHKSHPITPRAIKELILRANDDQSKNGLEWRLHIQKAFNKWLLEQATEKVEI